MVKYGLLLIALVFSQLSNAGQFEQDIVEAAIERTKHDVRYDGRYLSIPYPNGDVPAEIGVY